MSTENQAPWWELQDVDVAIACDADDYLHPEANALVAGDSVSETQYFGFNIPEKKIHAICYLWHHPHLGVVTGGVWVWQGYPRRSFESEIFDFVTYESDACLANDLHAIELSNGYRTEVIEPLKRHRVSYSDPKRGNAIDIEYEAVMPAVLMKNGKHFEQGMRARGWLTLGGERHRVDCVTVRDRSWGGIRSEAQIALPPATWLHCVFDEDLIVAITAFDTLDTDPAWKDDLQLPGGNALIGGWVWRDGELRSITELTSKRTRCDPKTLTPTGVEVAFTDSGGTRSTLRGEVLAAGYWQTWMNFDAAYCLTRYECDGKVSHGDLQEIQGIDYVRQATIRS